MPQIVENIKELLGQKPMFGICMGHQILGQVGIAAAAQLCILSFSRHIYMPASAFLKH